MSLYFVYSSAHQNPKAAPCGKSSLAGNTFQLFNSNHVRQSCFKRTVACIALLQQEHLKMHKSQLYKKINLLSSALKYMPSR